MGDLPPSARLAGIGFYVGICIVLGTLGGRELDKVFETGRALTVTGLALGLVLALWGGFIQLTEVLNAISQRRTEGQKRE